MIGPCPELGNLRTNSMLCSYRRAPGRSASLAMSASIVAAALWRLSTTWRISSTKHPGDEGGQLRGAIAGGSGRDTTVTKFRCSDSWFVSLDLKKSLGEADDLKNPLQFGSLKKVISSAPLLFIAQMHLGAEPFAQAVLQIRPRRIRAAGNDGGALANHRSARLEVGAPLLCLGRSVFLDDAFCPCLGLSVASPKKTFAGPRSGGRRADSLDQRGELPGRKAIATAARSCPPAGGFLS